MDIEKLKQLLDKFKRGDLGEEALLEELRFLPFEDLGFAKVDHHRHLRTGFPEVVFGEGKSEEQILSIADRIVKKGNNFLVTRCDKSIGDALFARYPDGVYYSDGKVFALAVNEKEKFGYVLVITAGTSDIPAAEEAAVTASLFGCNVDRIYDVGVAGIHRLLAYRSMIEAADVVVVAAGMEGALASVVGSITQAPVIALPTSVGYGASFEGLAALLGMLNSCAAGVCVVNIDNGFGAGCTAALICARARELAKAIAREK
ncbi:MAG: nickel pincer cofactor biosynthesis protein LarB [Candidatus Latescibacteria bacterium]|nr:nickel pincer cofactor biosynthesis protein LarB [Candidatus Latescibacterota bacterium]NIM66463.1 nickel pincer cofactor biosynthesis protein LarB [Candidatus Latescibacterota bacterium]NIO02943.1 nickel pincer cofactor biosynthesis protein LarB [Candidatus Latescibacterota bacterium]NIO30078.1 nickel pincer cofactor biosynthesis protein LarB [Candidatus Latescibacterota bacterium]NIO57693.1 nickel pincer cofactor biosynthesis protein LarB [Candidatus Latescibacterota bacterium]